jgi:hypothetical protein
MSQRTHDGLELGRRNRPGVRWRLRRPAPAGLLLGGEQRRDLLDGPSLSVLGSEVSLDGPPSFRASSRVRSARLDIDGRESGGAFAAAVLLPRQLLDRDGLEPAHDVAVGARRPILPLAQPGGADAQRLLLASGPIHSCGPREGHKRHRTALTTPSDIGTRATVLNHLQRATSGPADEAATRQEEGSRGVAVATDGRARRRWCSYG